MTRLGHGRRLAVILLMALPPLMLTSFEAFAQSGVNRRINRQVQRAIDTNTRLAVRRQLLKLRVDGSAGSVSALDVTSDGKYLATLSADRVPRVWNLEAGRQSRVFAPLSSDPVDLEFSPDGRKLVVVGVDGQIAILDTVSGERADSERLDARPTALAMAPDGTRVAIGTESGRIRLLNLTGSSGGADLTGHTAPVTGLAFGRTAQFLASGDSSGAVRVWEVSAGTAVRRLSTGGPVTSIAFGADESEVLVGTQGGGITSWRGDGGSADATYSLGEATPGPVTALAGEPGLETLAAAVGGDIVLWRRGTTSPTRVIKQAHVQSGKAETVRSLRFEGSGKRLVSGGDDGLAKVWDIESGKAIVSLISTRDGWAAIDAEGRFDGSNAGMTDVKWVAERQVLPIENFSEAFYEPGLVARKRLGQIAELPSGLVSLQEGILPPPEMQVELPASNDASGARVIRVTVTARDEGGGVNEVRLYHNGKIVPEQRRTSRNEQGEGTERRVTSIFEVISVAGLNRFTALASSQEGIFSQASTAELTINRTPRQPVLHLLLIAVNKYQDDSLELNYALPDAKAILESMGLSGRTLFSEVKVTRVFDQEATQAGVKKALEGLANSEPEDVIVVYAAGHGEALDGEFYFVPYDYVRPFSRDKLKQVGVSSAHVKDVLTRLPAQRVLLLLDTCKSGQAVQVLRDFADRRILHQLGSGVGLHLVAATAKDQFAAELDKLGHGVFTYSVLEAVKGKADTEPQDGRVTVKEMVAYAEKVVPGLSAQFAENEQFPLVFSRGLDFTVGRVTSP